MKFNLGDQVKIKSNGVVGIIIARGYNEYLDENDKQQSFEEYQIEAEKYYQCNEDEIELVTIGQVLQSIYDIPPQIKIKERKCCGNCCEFDKSTGICEYDNIAVCRDSGICENYYPSVQEVEVEDNDDSVNPFMKEYERIVTDTMELCKKKNKDYGSSVQDTFEKFGDVSYLVRITDKYNRICSLLENKKVEVRDESITDTIVDLANYCFLWASSRSLKGDK